MVRSRLILGLLVCVAFAASAPSAARAEDEAPLLENGGFEAGIAPWEEGTGPRQASGATLLPVGNAFEGKQAAALTLAAPSGGASQMLPSLPPGATYQASARVLIAGGTIREVRVLLSWQLAGRDDGRSSSPQAPIPGRWAQLTTLPAPVPCGADNASVTVVASGGAGATLYIDDIWLEEVSPPPTPCPTATPTPRPVPGVRPTVPPGATATPARQTGAPNAPATAQSLANGGFEDGEGGRPAAWRAYGGRLTQAESPVHGGRFAGAFSSATDSTKWAHQTVRVTPGAWYELDGYVYLEDPRVEGALLRVSWYASDDGSGSALASVDSTSELTQPEPRYRHLTTGPAQAPPGARSARTRVLLRPRSAQSAVIYIDDVSFRQTAPGPPDGEAAADASEGGPSARGRSGETVGSSGDDAGRSLAPRPSPVIRRRDRVAAPFDSPAGESSAWWSWVVGGGGALAAGGTAWGLWRRRRTRHGRSVRER